MLIGHVPGISLIINELHKDPWCYFTRDLLIIN